ncbi:unnamed protein product [Lepeophtheirus salmonis]|uniref:(salmon louse) hypothetical protein n=1 Tax=Lepeophtheirus salmonis TaxID=72036 RepID=A0A7R8H9K8_LEPSM|nr:unnamed protein product [Lepeophtheirus salmonis]CAF2957369.1 unnamed protein product [Lepeophtheirus salmonis]
MEYTLKKDKDLSRIFGTIPMNAIYTSHHIKNEIIEIMSTIIREETVKEIGAALAKYNEGSHSVLCTSLYKYFKKPTVAAVYMEEKLKWLLEQRRGGNGGHRTFEGHYPAWLPVYCLQILNLLDPPNTALQVKLTDFYTGVRLVQSALACVGKLRCDTQFDIFWRKFCQDRQTTEPPVAAPPQKRPKNLSHLRDYAVNTTVGPRQKEAEERTVCKRQYFSILDAVVG